uniref:Uncharacterized protein n=1 Tax=Tetraselmis sp. GSL018 TaxID=582737 RepID=A0A061RXS2_9CHLO
MRANLCLSIPSLIYWQMLQPKTFDTLLFIRSHSPATQCLCEDTVACAKHGVATLDCSEFWLILFLFKLESRPVFRSNYTSYLSLSEPLFFFNASASLSLPTRTSETDVEDLAQWVAVGA